MRAASPVRAGALAAIAAAAFLVIVLLVGGADRGAPGFLLEALGPEQAQAPLTRTPAPGVGVQIDDDGYTVSRAGVSVSVEAEDLGGADWRRHVHGVTRETEFGAETIVVDGNETEEFLTVATRQGERTWRWKLDTRLVPRLSRDGAVAFLDPTQHRVSEIVIDPVRILDADGRDVTPEGLRWGIEAGDSGRWLTLHLDDAELPLPYVIDPAVTHRASQGANNGAGAANLTLPVPAGTVQNDLLVAQIALRNTNAITPPAGWTTLVDTTNTIRQATYYRVAGASEPANYTWTFASVAAAGGMSAFYGIKATAPHDVTGAPTNANSTTVTAAQVTTTATDALVLAFFSVRQNSALSPAAGMTERYEARASGGVSASMDSMTQAAIGPTGNKTSTVTSGRNIGHQVAFRVDNVLPSSTTSFPASAGSYNTAGWNAGCAPSGLCGTASDADSGLQRVELSIRRGAGNYWNGTTFGSAVEVWNTTTLVAGNWSYAFGAASFPANGSYMVRVRSVDWAGNVEAPASRTFTYDTVAPQTTIDSQPANPTNATSANFTFSSSEGGSTFECELDSGGFSACVSPKNYAGLAEGSHTFRVRATDPAGNVDASPASYTWTVDTTAPQTTIDSQPADPTNATGASFTFSASEGGSTFECELDGAGFSACSSPRNYFGLADGSHIFNVRATDPAGNQDATPATYTWTVDTAAPQTTIDSQPADPTNATGANFTFSASQSGSTFECELDSGGFSACTSPKNYASLAEGSHTFRVRATDPAGNTDASPATYTWTIDTTAPQTTIDSQPVDPTNATGANFTFSASQSGSTFECELDSGGFSACTSPRNYAGLAEGSHTFRVRATDPAGNTDASPATYTWTIDTTAPQTTIDSQPADPSNDTSPDFTFSASEGGSSFECELDGAGFSACTSPKSYTGLSDGSHTFKVRATDPAGNTDPTPASYTWTVDTAAPQTTIDSQPADPTNATGANFTFSASEGGSTFQCELDGAGFSACVSPKSYAGLADGSHTLKVRATDAAGNTDPTAATYTWTVDTAAPQTTIDSQPADPSNDTAPDFTFSAGQLGSTFECELDSGGFSACTSPTSYTGLADGSHTFKVRATDPAGNTDGSPATYTWTVDTAAPQTTIDSQPADPTNATGASFTFSASEGGSTYECELDSGGFSACTSPKSYASLADGAHNFKVRATDAAGNTDGSPATYTWTVDTAAPQTTIDSQPTDPSNDTSPDFTFSASEGGSTYECELDGAGFSACTSPKNYTGLSEGSHTFKVRATDAAGNTDATPATYTWTIDTSAPQTTIDTEPADPSNDTSPDFTFSASEGGSTYECELDGAGFSACTSPKSYTGLSDGSHTFNVRATDAAGNTDPTAATYTWTVDTAAPQTTVDTQPTDPSNDDSPAFTFSASEGGSTYECELDGAGFSACTSPKSYTGLSDGSHNFKVRATDAADNTDGSPASYTWTVDTAAPQTTIDSQPADPSNNASPDFTFSASQPGSTFQCELDSAGFSACTSPKSYTGLADGSHTFKVRATDPAGNTDATPASYTWTVDTAAPQTTIDSQPTDPSNDTSPDFTFSASEGGSSFQCELDGAGFSACTSPKNYAGLSDGSHTFKVRATDAAGNTDATPATYTWTVDTAAPQTTIDSAPSDPSNDDTPDSTFSAGESGSTFQCDLDGAGFAPCTSPATVGPLADGSHTFRVRAIDQAGNTDPTPAARTWTVDTTAPDTGFTLVPADPTNDSTPTFEFSATEGSSTFACRLDGGSWSPCTSPETLGPLADGSHTFEARATDAAGNTDATAASYTWVVDAVAPTISVTQPAGYVNAAAADPFPVRATSPDGDVVGVEFFRCDNASAACATGSWVTLGTDGSAPYEAPWPVDTDGNRALRAVATDLAGNTGQNVVDVTIDRTLPSTTIDSQPTDPSGSAAASFSFSANEPGSTFECRLDASAFAPCTSPKSYAGLTDGSHTFRVRATDLAGNVEAAPRTVTWTVDTAAPETAIDIAPPDPSSSGAPSFAFSASEPGSTLACELDGGGFSACVSPKSYAGLADGSHTFKVRATDPAGNTDPTPAVYTWTVDATPPGGGLADPGANLRGTVILSASPSDTGAGVRDVEFQLSPANAGIWTPIGLDATEPYTASWNTTLVPDALYDLRVVVTDNAGNATPSAVVEDRRVDNTAPIATMNDPGAFLRATVGLSATALDAGSGVASVSFQRSPAGAGSWNATPASWDTTAVADGLYDLRTTVTDVAGNTTVSLPVPSRRVDNTKPSLSSSLPADGATVTSTGSLLVTAGEDVAGLANASLDGAPAPAPSISGATLTWALPFADGPHTLAGELEDLAGNRRAIRVHFTAWSSAGGDYPYVEKNSYAGATVSLRSASDSATATMPAGGWTGAPAGDWLVLRVDPQPAGGVPSGFAAAGNVLDVTAYWALDGTEVHQFAQPVEIDFDNSAARIVPATLDGGSWRPLALVPSGQELPAGWADGFYRDGSNVVVLTRHLSLFALLQDVNAPSVPGGFKGTVKGTKFTLSWKASSDNSAVAGYRLYANGALVATLGRATLSRAMGTYKLSDARAFQVTALDVAGNESAKSPNLKVIPKVARLKLAAAKKALAKRGFKAGKVSYVRSPSVPKGAVINGSAAGLRAAGSKIGLSVSSGKKASSSPRTSSAAPPPPSSSSPPPPPAWTPPPSSYATPAPAPTAPAAETASEAPFAGTGQASPEIKPQPLSGREDFSLRQLLGLGVLGAALGTAAVAGLRFWNPIRPAPATPTGLEPMLLWDARLLRGATSAIRRLTGRP